MKNEIYTIQIELPKYLINPNTNKEIESLTKTGNVKRVKGKQVIELKQADINNPIVYNGKMIDIKPKLIKSRLKKIKLPEIPNIDIPKEIPKGLPTEVYEDFTLTDRKLIELSLVDLMKEIDTPKLNSMKKKSLQKAINFYNDILKNNNNKEIDKAAKNIKLQLDSDYEIANLYVRLLNEKLDTMSSNIKNYDNKYWLERKFVQNNVMQNDELLNKVSDKLRIQFKLN